MMPQKPKKTSLSVMVLLAALAIGVLMSLVTTSRADAASLTAANRCMPTGNRISFVYSCPAAFPESFTLEGSAIGARYHVNWSVSCDGKTVAGSEEDGGLVVHVYAGRFSRKGTQDYEAFTLMESALGSCTIRVAGQRIAGLGRFKGGLAINVNHPLPVHN